MITGYFGTGKSLLLRNKAVRLAEAGHRVLFISILSLNGIFDEKMEKDLSRYPNIQYSRIAEVISHLKNTESTDSEIAEFLEANLLKLNTEYYTESDDSEFEKFLEANILKLIATELGEKGGKTDILVDECPVFYLPSEQTAWPSSVKLTLAVARCRNKYMDR